MGYEHDSGSRIHQSLMVVLRPLRHACRLDLSETLELRLNVTRPSRLLRAPRRPIHDAPTAAELYDAISNQIGPSHVIVIPTGMYATLSNWVGKEIRAANNLDKPILAVNPWGQQRASREVQDSATKPVGRTKGSVVSGIWDLYSQANR